MHGESERLSRKAGGRIIAEKQPRPAGLHQSEGRRFAHIKSQ